MNKIKLQMQTSKVEVNSTITQKEKGFDDGMKLKYWIFNPGNSLVPVCFPEQKPGCYEHRQLVTNRQTSAQTSWGSPGGFPMLKRWHTSLFLIHWISFLCRPLWCTFITPPSPPPTHLHSFISKSRGESHKLPAAAHALTLAASLKHFSNVELLLSSRVAFYFSQNPGFHWTTFRKEKDLLRFLYRFSVSRCPNFAC